MFRDSAVTRRECVFFINVKLHYPEQNKWINPSSLFDSHTAKYTISIQSACLCETSTDSIFPSLVCSLWARSICLPLTVAAREARLSHSLDLRSPCESLYKKFPVVTFVSWKVVVWRGSYKEVSGLFFFPLSKPATYWWSCEQQRDLWVSITGWRHLSYQSVFWKDDGDEKEKVKSGSGSWNQFFKVSI